MSTQLAEIADSRDRIEQMPQDAREMLIASNLEQADAWLRAALDVPSPDPRSIVDYKVQVAAIEQMARQLRVSKDLQNHATKCVHRAQRGIGIALRKGQEDGTVAKSGDIGIGRSPLKGDLILYGVDEILSHLDVVIREQLDHDDDLSHLDAAIDALSHGAFVAAGYLLSDFDLNLIVEDLPEPETVAEVSE